MLLFTFVRLNTLLSPNIPSIYCTTKI